MADLCPIHQRRGPSFDSESCNLIPQGRFLKMLPRILADHWCQEIPIREALHHFTGIHLSDSILVVSTISFRFVLPLPVGFTWGNSCGTTERGNIAHMCTNAGYSDSRLVIPAILSHQGSFSASCLAKFHDLQRFLTFTLRRQRVIRFGLCFSCEPLAATGDQRIHPLGPLDHFHPV